MTLTTRPAPNQTPEDLYRTASRATGRLFEHFRRETGQRTQYCRILELTQKGYPHFHFLARGPWWNQKEISRVWQKLTRAFIVDIRRIKSHQTISYVAKYTTKETFSNAQTFWVRKRITSSRKFFSKQISEIQYADFWKPRFCPPEEFVDTLTLQFDLVPVGRHNYTLNERTPGTDVPTPIQDWLFLKGKT